MQFEYHLYKLLIRYKSYQKILTHMENFDSSHTFLHTINKCIVHVQSVSHCFQYNNNISALLNL